jgi:hypothetical protein
MGIKVDSSSHSVDDGFGLLVDFLLHEVVVLSLHDLGELDLEMLNSSDRRETVVSSKSVNVEFWISAEASLKRLRRTSFGDVGNIVILEVEDSFGVLDNGTGVGSDKELDRLGHTVFRHEGSGLRSSKLGASWGLSSISSGDREETAWDVLVLDC